MPLNKSLDPAGVQRAFTLGAVIFLVIFIPAGFGHIGSFFGGGRMGFLGMLYAGPLSAVLIWVALIPWALSLPKESKKFRSSLLSGGALYSLLALLVLPLLGVLLNMIF